MINTIYINFKIVLKYQVLHQSYSLQVKLELIYFLNVIINNIGTVFTLTYLQNISSKNHIPILHSYYVFAIKHYQLIRIPLSFQYESSLLFTENHHR